MSALKGLVVGVMGLFFGSVGIADVRPESEQPLNIVLITADDLGLQLGCYGDVQAKTPNIDRLADEGILFKRAYVTYASCSSSRASILTGLYPTQNGQTWLADRGGRMKPGMPMLPNLLKSAGYRTAILGKLHVTAAAGENFQFDSEWAKEDPRATRDVREMASRADAFIKSKGDQPFFLYVNYFDPHDEPTPDPKLRYGPQINQVKGLPEKVLNAGDVKTLSFFGIDDLPTTASDMACYYNCIHRLDDGVGMLLDVLKENGVEKNTLVIFLSDNGPAFARGKGTCYSAGVHVPFIVRWPGVVRPGLTTDALISGVDITPTILDAACVETDKKAAMSGISFVPLLNGTAASIRHALAVEYIAHDLSHYYPRRGIVDDRYLYIHNLMSGQRNPCIIPPWKMPAKDHPMHEAHARFLNPPKVEFFDVSRDPDCLDNLASHPERASAIKGLADELQAWRKKIDDPLLQDGEMEREAARFMGLQQAGKKQ